MRTDLARGDTAVPVEIVTGGAPSTLIVQGLKLAPGASSGWHTHPGTEYSAINTGGVAQASVETRKAAEAVLSSAKALTGEAGGLRSTVDRFLQGVKRA